MFPPPAGPVAPVEAAVSRPARPPAVSLADEMARAQGAFNEATKVIRSLMAEVRLGKAIDMESVRPVVEKVTASVLRNSNAMLTLRRLQQRDDYTYLHSVGVCTLLVAFGKGMDMDEATLHQLALGGILHDVGKMRIAEAIVTKPARLTDQEYRVMRSHVVQGVEVIRAMPGIPRVAQEVVAQHHERMDGSGYPRGLTGEAISQVGRMAAIVDVYDALTSDRYYHRASNPAEAVARLFEWSKTLFDPALVQAFVRIIGIYPVGALVRLESGRLAVVMEQNGQQLLLPRVKVIFDTRRNYYLPPEDLDLARPKGGPDKVLGVESPEKWGIDVGRFLVVA